MKNIKKVVLYSIITIATTTHHCSGAWPAWMVAIGSYFQKIEMPKPAGVAAVNAAGDVLKGNLPIVKDVAEVVTKGVKDVAEIVTDGVVDTANILAPATVDASAKIGVEAAKQFAPAANIVAGSIGAGVAIYGVIQLYPIAKEIKSGLRPTKEEIDQQRAREERAEETLELLKTKKEFRNCLKEHRLSSDVGNTGLPRACEGLVKALCDLDYCEEVEKVMNFYQKYRN